MRRRAEPRPGAVASKPSGGQSAAGEPQALVVTHAFDSGHDGSPHAVTIRLTGRKAGAPRWATGASTFVHSETVDPVIPGTGLVAISSWIYGLDPGEWLVAAELVRDRGPELNSHKRRGQEQITSAAWSWRRWAVVPAPPRPIPTRWALIAPLARIPAVLPGSFTAFGVLAFLVALFVQTAVIAPSGIAPARSLAASLIALLAGLIGAKAWSRILHPGEPIIGPGWAVDGFLVFAPLTSVAMVFALAVPIEPYLAASTPGIFFAVALGRIGCFLTGCCAGRPTGSRFGIWSSDRRVGARRVPTQLLEAAAGLVIGAVTLALVVAGALPGPAIFAMALAVYLAIRHLLLRLRAEPRHYLWQRAARPVRTT